MGESVGTSTAHSIPWVIARLREIRPASVLDIGCGFGRWGFLAREFLEVWEHRYRPGEWALRIDAIDIHAPTWSPVHEYIYDRLITADVRGWEPDRAYDAAIACDVLEHMPKTDALAVLAKLRGCCARVLVGVPLGPGWTRPGFDGNPHEAHVSAWEPGDFPGASGTELLRTEDGLGYGMFLLG